MPYRILTKSMRCGNHFHSHLTDENTKLVVVSLPRVLTPRELGPEPHNSQFVLSLLPPWRVCTLNEIRRLIFEWCFSFFEKPSRYSVDLSFLAAQLVVSFALAVEGPKQILLDMITLYMCCAWEFKIHL